MSFSILFLYLLTGSIAGFLAGLFGVGGGIIIVPALLAIFLFQGFDPTVSMHLALGTSLASIVLTSISSARAHHAHGAVQWTLVKQMTLGLLIGGLFGALIVKQLQSGALQIIFAIFVIFVALKLLSSEKATIRNKNKIQSKDALLSAVIFNVTGFVISAVSAVVGIGGGTLSVPFLRWVGLSMQKAVATSAALGLPIAISGSLAFIWIGSSNMLVPAMSLGFVYLPAFISLGVMSVLFAPLGAKLAHYLPESVLQKGFAVGLLVIGGLLLIS